MAMIREVVLLGGGHSHVEVLRQWGRAPVPGVALTLVSRHAHTPYSGMLPGVVAGHYSADQAQIDLRALARFAGARFVLDEADGVDLAAHRLSLRREPPVRFDLLSVNSGSTPSLAVPGAASFAVPVKPVDGFLEHWEGMRARLVDSTSSRRVAVVGGGAGGVEVLFSMWQRLQQDTPHAVEYHLFTDSSGVLPTYDPRVRGIIGEALHQRGIHVHARGPVVDVTAGRIRTHDGTVFDVDEILWATGASAPGWLGESGLDVDAGGFVRVSSTLQSISHGNVFAAGDVAALEGRSLPKAGVYAVRQGPVLAHNLRRAALGKSLRAYRPQRHALSLISTGNRYAIASRGSMVVHGAWVWRVKDWIDRRFISAYSLEP